MSGSAARGRATRPRGGTRLPRLPRRQRYIKPAPVEEPAPSKKLKQRVIKGTED